MVAAHRPGRNAACFAEEPPRVNDRADAHIKNAGRLPPRQAAFNRCDNALAQVLRIGLRHPCWPPSPAASLNYNLPLLGNPKFDSIRSDNALTCWNTTWSTLAATRRSLTSFT